MIEKRLQEVGTGEVYRGDIIYDKGLHGSYIKKIKI